MKKTYSILIALFFAVSSFSGLNAFNSDRSFPVIVFPGLLKTNDIVLPIAKLTGLTESLESYSVNFYIVNVNDTIYQAQIQTEEVSVNDTLVLSFELWTALHGQFEAVLEISPLENNEIESISINKSFRVINGVDRNCVILEEGTGTSCTYCPAAANGLEQLLDNNFDVAIIAYHTADEYQTVESWYRTHDYYYMAVFPCVKFDGTQEIVGGGLAPESMFSEYIPVVESRLAVPTPIELEIEVFENNKEYFGANIHITKHDSVSGPLVLQAVLTETHIYDPWEGLQYVNHVERKMFPDKFGTGISFTNQTDTTIPVYFEIEDDWNIDHCEMVVFVQNYETWEIYNGDKIDVMNILPSKASFFIHDSTGLAIENAIVTVNSDLAISDTSGIAYHNLTPGNYNYSVKKDGFNPYFGEFVIGVEDIEIDVMLSIANILFQEDFSTTSNLENWTVEGLGQPNWSITETDFASGFAPELSLLTTPLFNDVSKLLSPVINTQGKTKLLLRLYHSLDFDLGEYEIKIETTVDGSSWNTIWNPEISTDINHELVEIVLDNEDIGSDTFQFAFVFDGNSFNLGGWYIDDIFLIESLNVFNVSFNVDMSGNSEFVPDQDKVYLSGNFDGEFYEPGEAGTFLMSTNELDMTYATTLQLLEGEYTYKYFVNEGWDGSEPGDVRFALVVSDTVINNSWGTNDVKMSGKKENFTVFPNPFSENLHIKVDAEEQLNISVYTLRGELVFSKKYNQQSTEKPILLDASSWEEGLYIVYLMFSNYYQVKKVSLIK